MTLVARMVVVGLGLGALVACGGRLALTETTDEGGSSGGKGSANGGAAANGGANPGSGGASGGSAGANGSAGGTVDPRGCKQPPLGLPYPVLGICQPDSADYDASRSLLCPFNRQVNVPDYGPFVGCCPVDTPYACANSTPFYCLATAALAAESCGSDCVACAAR